MAAGVINVAAKDGWSAPFVSDIYEKTRPNYNMDSVEFLLEKIGAFQPHSASEPFRIVELGAGTGKFTRAVLRVFEKRAVKNVKIISTEPIKEMCEKFKEMVPNVEILQRPAHNLGLPNSSADAVLAAQCFHWFGSNMKSINEIHRVLKPKGILGVIWNLPDRSVSWIKAIEGMLDEKYQEINILHPDHKDTYLQLKTHGGFGTQNGDNSYRFSMESSVKGVIERYKAVSVVSAAETSEREAMLSKIEKEMKTNPDVKDPEKCSYDFVIKINWFQKSEDSLNELNNRL